MRFNEIFKFARPSVAGLFCLEIDTHFSLKLLPLFVFHCFSFSFKFKLSPGLTLFCAEEVRSKSLELGEPDGDGLLDALTLLDLTGLKEERCIEEFCLLNIDILVVLMIGRVLLIC